MRQPDSAGVDENRQALSGHAQSPVLLLYQRLDRFDGRLDARLYRHDLAPKFDLALRDSRYIEKVSKQPGELCDGVAVPTVAVVSGDGLGESNC